MVPLQRLDQDEIRREPDRAAPVRVPAEHVGGRLTRRVFHLVGGAAVREHERMILMCLGKRTDTKV